MHPVTNPDSPIAAAGRCLLAAAIAMASASRLSAQTPLPAAVDACLDAATDADYGRLRDELLPRPEATGDAVLEALRTRPAPLRGSTTFIVPFDGMRLQVRAEAPEQRRPDALLPVLYAVNWSSQYLYDAVREHAITAEVPEFHPDQFSDAARNAHVAVLNAIAWRTGGDPDALWWTGFSWGGHACWDDAMHRPGWARGCIGRGGGPRRVSFRLLPNLVGTEVLAVCGRKDDAELVWNLREVQRTQKELGLAFTYWEAPDSGHDQPLPGENDAGTAMLATAATAATRKFTLLADGKDVEHPLFLVLAVDDRAVTLPAQIPVSARLSADEQRRATLRAMQKQVASVAWEIAEPGAVKTVTLTAKGCKRGRFAFRAPWFAPGDSVRVLVGKKEVFAGRLLPDPRTMLDDARRTGARLRPALRTVDVAF